MAKPIQNNRWTIEDVSLLREIKDLPLNEQVDRFLGKFTKSAIQHKRHKLQVNPDTSIPWTDSQNDIILYGDGKYTIDQLAEKTEHSYSSVEDRIRKLRRKGYDIKTAGSFGVDGREEWTTQEIEILQKNAKNLTPNELHKLLPTHTEDSIILKCWRADITRKHRPNYGANGALSPVSKYTGEISGQVKATIRLNAQKRGIHIDNTPEFWYYCWNLLNKTQNNKCVRTGLPLIIRNPHRKGNASLDRIDSKKGYVVGNVQWVHKRYNEMKNNETDERCVAQCAAIIIHSFHMLDASLKSALKQILEKGT